MSNEKHSFFSQPVPDNVTTDDFLEAITCLRQLGTIEAESVRTWVELSRAIADIGEAIRRVIIARGTVEDCLMPPSIEGGRQRVMRWWALRGGVGDLSLVALPDESERSVRCILMRQQRCVVELFMDIHQPGERAERGVALTCGRITDHRAQPPDDDLYPLAAQGEPQPYQRFLSVLQECAAAVLDVACQRKQDADEESLS